MATVKKPKWKKATGTEGAISVKGGVYPVKGTGVGGGKVRAEVSKSNTGTRKRADGVIITRTSPNKYPKMTKEQKSNVGKQQLQIMKTRKVLTKKQKQRRVQIEKTIGRPVDWKNVVKAKSPTKISYSKKLVLGAAAGAAVGYVVAKNKKSPVVIKKKSPVVIKKKNLRIDKTGKPSRYTSLKRNNR